MVLFTDGTRTPSVMSAAPGVVFSVKELQKAPGFGVAASESGRSHENQSKLFRNCTANSSCFNSFGCEVQVWLSCVFVAELLITQMLRLASFARSDGHIARNRSSIVMCVPIVNAATCQGFWDSSLPSIKQLT